MITGLPFFIQLGLTLLLFWNIRQQRVRIALLTVSSVLFIYISQKYALLTLVPVAILSYAAAVQISKVHERLKAIWLFVTIVLLLLLMFFFKVPQYFLDILQQVQVARGESIADKLIYPIGLSYLIFKAISYVADVYWGKVAPGRFEEYFSFLSLFTIYTAGPIERFSNFQPQITQPAERYKIEDFEYGVYRMVIGLFKKIVLANWIGYFLHEYLRFQNGTTSWEMQIIGLFIFSLQLYFDFSGYSDIAIGSSRMFGLTIMENFNAPFLKPNIAQFWQSWHISLSSWIRDYIFYPLSLADFIRKIDFQVTRDLSFLKIWNMVFLPIIAFTLCGLWHGVSTGFIAWGALHGIALAIYQVWYYNKKKFNLFVNSRFTNIGRVMGIVLTYSFISLTWYFFH